MGRVIRRQFRGAEDRRMSLRHHVKAIKMLCEFLSGEAVLIRPHHSVGCRPHFIAKYYYLWNVEGHNKGGHKMILYTRFKWEIKCILFRLRDEQRKREQQ